MLYKIVKLSADDVDEREPIAVVENAIDELGRAGPTQDNEGLAGVRHSDLEEAGADSARGDRREGRRELSRVC